MKDAKALEAYVHKHIFPKVSPEMRMYLTQYFTVLFSDGFESGDFSAWTGTSGSPSIVVNNYTKYGEVIAPEGTEDYTTWGGVLKVGSTYHAYYTYRDGDDKLIIGHATSSDGKTWAKDSANNPVLNLGASGKFDENGVWCPNVWKEGSTWHMLYDGSDSSLHYAVGYATSSDGVTWTRQNSGNAVLSGTAGQWDENDVEGWGLIKVGSTYYLWYNTLSNLADRKVGLATSTDLLTWSKDANNPIFSTASRFCVFPYKVGSTYYLLVPHYTSGTDYAEIEIYSDSNPTFYSGSRTYKGVILRVSGSGWDSLDLDTPFMLTDDVTRSTFTLTPDEYWVYYAGQSGSTWGMGLAISPMFFAHHGSNTMLSDGANNEYVYKDFAGGNPRRFRAYYYLSALPTSGNNLGLLSSWDSGVSKQVVCRVYNDAGTVKWQLWIDGGTFLASSGPSVGTWYCVEIVHTDSGGDLYGELWINGASVVSGTKEGIGVSSVSRGYFGGWNKTSSINVYVDCCVIADAYIGPESTVTLKTVTDATALSDAVYRNKSLVIADTSGLTETILQNKTLAANEGVDVNDAVLTDKIVVTADALNLAGNIIVDKVLQATEAISLVETVQVGVGGAKKTKLFLILGDLAVQLTGE